MQHALHLFTGSWAAWESNTHTKKARMSPSELENGHTSGDVIQIAGTTLEQESEHASAVCPTASRAQQATHPECIHHVRLLQELGEGSQYGITD